MIDLIVNHNFQTPEYADVRGAGRLTVETMGERIRRLREAHRLTQQQLADQVGLSKAAISAWERGIADNIKLAPLEKLLQVLHTDLQYLIHGHGRSGHVALRHPVSRSGRKSGDES